MFLASFPGHQAMRPFFDRVNFDPATAAMVALSAFSAASQISTANKQAKATIAEGNIVASNKAKEVAMKAASQRVSFLNSGLTLEGTPMNVIDSTFNTGLEDIGQIRSNYNSAAKNKISAGRTAALTSLASGFSYASLPGMDMPGAGVGNSWNSLGQSVGGAFDPSPMGPYQAPWG